MKILNVILLLNILTPSHSAAHLSSDVEDRRNETKLHKYVTIQWDNFTAEFNTYVLKGTK